MALGGLSTEQATTVESVVDQLLRDPSGAQAFIEPFAASWARLLGEDDPRPTEFDLARLLADLDEAIEPLDLSGFTGEDEQLIVPTVPLPRTQLEWMGSTRRTIDASILPLGLAAVAFAAIAFAVGNRRGVLRRIGIWGVTAGMLWVLIPPLLTWAARAWTPGADAVVSTSLDEATDGLRLPALVLVAGGLAAIGISFLLPARAPADVLDPAAAPPLAGPPPSGDVTPTATPRPVAQHVATIPADGGAMVEPEPPWPSTIESWAPPADDDETPTGVLPVVGATDRPGEPADDAPATAEGETTAPGDGGDDGDTSVWDFYSR